MVLSLRMNGAICPPETPPSYIFMACTGTTLLLSQVYSNIHSIFMGMYIAVA